jgi:CDI immunity protein
MTYTPEHRQACAIYMNNKFIAVHTMSGWGMFMADPQGLRCRLAPDVSDSELGSTVLLALAKSRMVHPNDDPDLSSNQNIEERYHIWLADLMQSYGYKTKSALFKGMKLCNLEVKNGQMTFRPTKRERGDGFGSTLRREKDHVHLPAQSSPEEVGAAVRLALSRSIG